MTDLENSQINSNLEDFYEYASVEGVGGDGRMETLWKYCWISKYYEFLYQRGYSTIELALPENLSGRAVFHPAASSIFSIKIPYPQVGSFTKTWVTAPISLPSCRIGLPDTSDWHCGQQIVLPITPAQRYDKYNFFGHPQSGKYTRFLLQSGIRTHIAPQTAPGSRIRHLHKSSELQISHWLVALFRI